MCTFLSFKDNDSPPVNFKENEIGKFSSIISGNNQLLLV